MNGKLLCTLTTFVFVVMWGMLGFVSAPAAHGEPGFQETAIPPTVAVPKVIPVTGTPEPNVMMLLFYVFLGLLAIVLLIALFTSANRIRYARRDVPAAPPDELP